MQLQRFSGNLPRKIKPSLNSPIFDNFSLKMYLVPNNSVTVINVFRPPYAHSEALNKFCELIAPLINHEVIILGHLKLD